MANYLYKSKFDKDLGKFRKLIDNIGDLPENVPRYARQAVIYDAKNIANNMEQKYIKYLNTYSDMKELAKDAPPEPTVRVVETFGNVNEVGAKITFTAGKKTFYYEYGTGPIGKGIFTPKGHAQTKPYPAGYLPNGWVYGGGPKVIHPIKSNIIENLDGSTTIIGYPRWYTRLSRKHSDLTSNFDMWMSPMGISFGIPAGRFYYDAIQEYNSDLKDPELSYSGDPAMHKYGLRSMSGVIKHDLMDYDNERGFV